MLCISYFATIPRREAVRTSRLHVKASLRWIGGVPQKQPKSSSLELPHQSLATVYIPEIPLVTSYGAASVPKSSVRPVVELILCLFPFWLGRKKIS